MNIFVLDYDPTHAAHMLCDKHVVKMCLESAQLLCTAHHGETPYKQTHRNHPCAKWVRESMDNYAWLVRHALAICAEYTKRYGRRHKSQDVIEWAADNPPKLPEAGLTAFALAMPGQYRQDCPVASYRAYYKGEKAAMATWKTSEPEWWYDLALV